MQYHAASQAMTSASPGPARTLEGGHPLSSPLLPHLPLQPHSHLPPPCRIPRCRGDKTLAKMHISCALTAQVEISRRYCPTLCHIYRKLFGMVWDGDSGDPSQQFWGIEAEKLTSLQAHKLAN